MSLFEISFYAGSGLMICFALLSVTSPRLLRSAIYLLFVLVGVAVFYLVVDYMFLAAVQVVVYMGGILVLIIFSILLTSHISEKLEKPTGMQMAGSALACIIGAGVIISVVIGLEGPFTGGGEPNTVSLIGTQLLSYTKHGYVLPFEVISILLLAAMVGAIVIAKRPNKMKND